MKKILLSLSAMFVFMTPSLAVQHNITMTAQVQGVCSLSPPNSLSGFTSGTAFSVLTATGKAIAKTGTLRLPYVCNSTGVSFRLSSDRQGITKQISQVPSGQTNKIHYTARTITPGGAVMSSLDTLSSSTGNLAVITEPSGEVVLEVAVSAQPNGSINLVPGNDYTDFLHLDIEPNP